MWVRSAAGRARTADGEIRSLDTEVVRLLCSAMGYRAPSSEDVYRYLLRIDQAERTLTDRFSWSMLLVSDYSPICREFMARYCLDLCARTADRIRFVFFSGIPVSEFDEIARQGKPPYGAVGSVLKRLGSRAWRSRIDFEDQYWRDLRPTAFLPFASVSQIEDHLDDERWEKAAMPGAEESLRFAQRLGIGRHVPCILAFTDIGDLEVHVLPFRDQTADQVYSRVRDWVDSYYEINRNLLEHWKSVEEQIQRLASEAAASLKAVRNWPERCRKDWQSLRQLAELIQALTDGQDTVVERLTAVEGDGNLPWELPNTIRVFRARLDDFDKELSEIEPITATADNLASQTTPEAIAGCIKKLVHDPPKYLHKSTSITIKSAWSELKLKTGQPVEPRPALLFWWQHRAVPLFSKRQFFDRFPGWQEIAGARKHAAESIGDHKRRDYAAFWTAVGAQPVTQRPADATNEILTALAAHYDVPASSDPWLSATGSLRAYLTAVLEKLQMTAPSWLLQSSPPLLIRECVPPAGEGRAPSLSFLESSPELDGLVRRVETAGRSESDIQAERLELHCRQRDLITRALRSDARRLSTVEIDRSSAFAALATLLETARARLETRLLEATTAKSSPRLAADPALFARLNVALDDYHHAVQRVVYPHLSDPMVIPVHVRTDLRDAGELPSYLKPDAIAQLRASMSAVAHDYHEAAASWPKAQREAAKYSPARLLEDALIAVLSPSRREDILAIFPGDSLPEKLNQLVRDGHTGSVLDTMTRPELNLLLTWLGHQKAAELPEAHVRLTMLTALGLGLEEQESTMPSNIPADAEQTLKRKIQRDEFDVFVSYHSADKPAALRICRALQRLGIYPWIDVEQIRPGTRFADAIQSAVQKVRSAAIIFGLGGTGPWQELEIDSVIDRGVMSDMPVIPVLLPGVREIPEKLPFIRVLHSVTFENTVLEEAPLQQLVWGITQVHPERRQRHSV